MRARIIKLLKQITLGYPMKRDPGPSLFTDVVSGLQVIGYTDTLGRRWMANHCMDLDRVERRS